MAQENYSDFVNSIQKSLEEGNTVHALTIFTDNKHSAEVKNNSWDLIPVISKFLDARTEIENIEAFKCCEKLITIVAEQSNPEEALLQFIEEIEESVDDVKFIVLLKPLSKIFFRVPDKRLNSLAWCFNAIEVYLKKLEIPEDSNLVGKEKLLLDSSETCQRITRVYSDLLPFYDMFIDEVKVNKNELRVKVVQKFLIQLLGRPLGCLDMEVFDDIKSRARIIVEHIVNKLVDINCDPMAIFKLKYNEKDGEMIRPHTLGVGVFFYLIYSENLGVYPKVYSPIYLFQNSIFLVTELLTETNQMLIEKGLDLAYGLLKHVEKLNLPHALLDSEKHCQFCKALSNVIVYNEAEFLRKKGLKIFEKYLNSFDGLIGYTITQYKEQLAKELNDNKMSEYYKDYHLFSMIKLFCHLPKGPETDLINISDQTMSTLNLLRFLALRDKNNATNIWQYFPKLEETYFKPLREALDLSRAHYELKIRELNEGNAQGDKSDVVVTVSGVNLPEMPLNDKLRVLNSSLTAFDIMDSLLSRVVECIEKK